MAKDSKGHGSDKRGMRGGADYTPNSPGPGFAGTRATKTRLQAESDAYMKKHAKKGLDAAYRKEQRETYKAGRAAQAAENQKIMGPTTGKAAQNMRDLVRAKIEDGKVSSTTTNKKY